VSGATAPWNNGFSGFSMQITDSQGNILQQNNSIRCCNNLSPIVNSPASFSINLYESSSALQILFMNTLPLEQ